MSQENFTFISHNLNCEGVVFLPETWVRPHRLPTIVIIPGASGYKIPPKKTNGDIDCGYGLIEMSKIFCQYGFAVFAYNGRGQGNSEGTRTSQKETLEDAKVAIEFLLEKVDSIDPSRIGLFGPSIGGAGALYVASQKSIIRSVVVWGTPPSWTKAKEDGRLMHSVEKLWKKIGSTKTLEEFSKEYETVDPVHWLQEVRQPVLIAGGSEDSDYFKDEEQKQLVQGLKNATQVMYLKVHGFSHRLLHPSPLFVSFVQILIGWYRATL